MRLCYHCGKEVDLPFRCPFCNGQYCTEHRLPENHNCLNQPARTPLGRWRAKKSASEKLPKITISQDKKDDKRTTEEGRFYFVKGDDQKRFRFKIHGYGLVAGILVLITLLLPWWYLQMSTSLLGVSFSVTATADLHKVIVSGEVRGNGGFIDVAEELPLNIWLGQVTTSLILVGGILAIVGGLISGKIGKALLIFAGVFVLVSIFVYAYGLHNELIELTNTLNTHLHLEDLPRIQLFSTGAHMGWRYSSYLHAGFWVDFASFILICISASRH